jgi:hypothetical protein
MDENIGWNFLPWNVYACYSTTKSAIDKWIAQPDSTHQIGLEPTLHEVLIIVESGDRGEASGIFHPQKLEMFSLVARDGLRAHTT